MTLGRIYNLQVRVVMISELFDAEDPESVCVYSEPVFALGEDRYLLCTRVMSGRYVRIGTLLTQAGKLEVLELEVHGF